MTISSILRQISYMSYNTNFLLVNFTFINKNLEKKELLYTLYISIMDYG